MENNTIKVIDNDVPVTIEVTARFMQVIYQMLDEMIDEYGKENFIKLAKEVVDNERVPQKGIEVHITALSSMITLFEQNAVEQGKSKEMTLEEYQKLIGS